MELKTKGNAFLNCFWDLASNEAGSRITAAEGIISHLQFASGGTEDQIAKDTAYALKRLVKGLSSSRESARLGFASCLVEVLCMERVSVTETLELLDEATRVTGSMKGSDERDVLFGRLFAFGAIIRSGRLREDIENARSVLDMMVELLTTKGWIREAVVECLLEFCTVRTLPMPILLYI
jgi:DNA polymerase phi